VLIGQSKLNYVLYLAGMFLSQVPRWAAVAAGMHVMLALAGEVGMQLECALVHILSILQTLHNTQLFGSCCGFDSAYVLGRRSGQVGES
jgi:hypothetical protein